MGLRYEEVTFYFFFNMSRKEFCTLAELQEAIQNDSNFLQQFDDDECDIIDVVELPPDNVDILTDEEDIDEYLLDVTIPTDVPGRLHVQSSRDAELSEEFTYSDPCPKKQWKEKVQSLWKKIDLCNKNIGDDLKVNERYDEMKHFLSGKSQCNFLNYYLPMISWNVL